jgi:hypothetical protein
MELEAWARPLAAAAETHARHALHWISARTGLPAVVVATLALVVAWRVTKRSWHVLLELAVAAAVVFAATRFGWIRW